MERSTPRPNRSENSGARDVVRLPLEGEWFRVAGTRPRIGRPGALLEIRESALHEIALPHSDVVSLATDDEGRLIAGRRSGDRLVRRYRGAELDATYAFRLEEVRSLAVAGSRVVVILEDGGCLGVDERTVPRVDYAYRMGIAARFVDAWGDRVLFTGKETILSTFDGRVLARGPGAARVRLRREGWWVIDEDLRTEGYALSASSLALKRVGDVLTGDEEWALGEALVRLDTTA